MEKPISIRRMEFNKNIADLINKSELPLCIVYDLLQSIVVQMSDMVSKQLQNDMVMWQQELEKQEKGENEDEVQ